MISHRIIIAIILSKGEQANSIMRWTPGLTPFIPTNFTGQNYDYSTKFIKLSRLAQTIFQILRKGLRPIIFL